MNTCGNAAMKSKREANSKVVQMIMKPGTQNTHSANAAWRNIPLEWGNVGLRDCIEGDKSFRIWLLR